MKKIKGKLAKRSSQVSADKIDYVNNMGPGVKSWSVYSGTTCSINLQLCLQSFS